MPSPLCPSCKDLLFCSMSVVMFLLLHLESLRKSGLEHGNLAGFLSLLMHAFNTVSVLLLKAQTIMTLYYGPNLKSLRGSITSGASLGIHNSWRKCLTSCCCFYIAQAGLKLPILSLLSRRWDYRQVSPLWLLTLQPAIALLGSSHLMCFLQLPSGFCFVTLYSYDCRCDIN